MQNTYIIQNSHFSQLVEEFSFVVTFLQKFRQLGEKRFSSAHTLYIVVANNTYESVFLGLFFRVCTFSVVIFITVKELHMRLFSV